MPSKYITQAEIEELKAAATHRAFTQGPTVLRAIATLEDAMQRLGDVPEPLFKLWGDDGSLIGYRCDVCERYAQGREDFPHADNCQWKANQRLLRDMEGRDQLMTNEPNPVRDALMPTHYGPNQSRYCRACEATAKLGAEIVHQFDDETGEPCIAELALAADAANRERIRQLTAQVAAMQAVCDAAVRLRNLEVGSAKQYEMALDAYIATQAEGETNGV